MPPDAGERQLRSLAQLCGGQRPSGQGAGDGETLRVGQHTKDLFGGHCRHPRSPRSRDRGPLKEVIASISSTLALSMQTTLEETDRHVVKLAIEVPPEEFARDLDKAYRKVAGQVRIPGFRKGKVPKQIIDARIGREHVLHEFVEEFVPAYSLSAIREHDLAPISAPEIALDPEEPRDGEPLRFTATV